MTRVLPRLHVVSDSAVLQLPDLERLAGSIARDPAVALHVRSGTCGGRRLLEIANLLRTAAQPRLASVFMNDRVDIALAAGVDGVHLPSAGLPTGAVRKLVGSDMWIGRSSHSAAEAIALCEEGADYAFLGPIWPTTSHPGASGIGIGTIAEANAVPIIAIGGITPERIPAVMDAGAYGVAAISAIWQSRDPGATVERMLLSFEL